MALQRQQDELRPVVAPADEQQWPEPGQAAPRVRRAAGGRVADAASAAALARMPRRDRFVPRAIACDPRFEGHNRRRLDWQRKRRQELHEMTGGVSHAVGAMIAAAGWLYAAGEFAAELGAEKGDVEAFKSAASLTATARTHDMGAWELATREGKARPRPALDYPWMHAGATDEEPTDEPATDDDQAEPAAAPDATPDPTPEAAPDPTPETT